MENSRESHLGTVVTAALIGGLAGAVVGLLLAPKSGRELRRDLQGKAETVLNQVEESDWLVKGKKFAEDLHRFLQEFPAYIKQKTHNTSVNTVQPNPANNAPASPALDQTNSLGSAESA